LEIYASLALSACDIAPMIDVALTPAQLRRSDVAVVIDVLRATSTATQALAAGYHRVLCTETIERALEFRGSGRILAGERNCVMPPGFDQGNSPAEAAAVRAEELVLATTNGAPAIAAASRQSETALVACLLNLGAVIDRLRLHGTRVACEVQIVCSGTDGAPALEDVYVAGRIAAALPGARTDAALIAESVARAYGDPLAALSASADAQALRTVGLDGDIAYCARESVLDVVPVAHLDGAGVAALVAGG
jgi:2-phosphosulfolactate phosphatase